MRAQKYNMAARMTVFFQSGGWPDHNIGLEEPAARASQPWNEALNLSGEGREKAAPVSTSADRSLCEPQDRSLRCASATAGPEPWGTRARASSRKNARRDRSVRGGSTSQCSQPALSSADHAFLPNRQHKECVYPQFPTRLDNAGSDKRTF